METISTEQKIQTLGKLFNTMVENHNTFGAIWKNIDLGKQAFAIMKELPDVIEGEFDSPADKAGILVQMLDQMEETMAPRFCIEVRKYIQQLNSDNESNNQSLEQLYDFIDIDLSLEEYCKKYSKLLKFDPIERTQEWEDIIYQVEKECAEILKNEPTGMGFCFSYWSIKTSVLQKYDICWKSPSKMNPRVIFD